MEHIEHGNAFVRSIAPYWSGLWLPESSSSSSWQSIECVGEWCSGVLAAALEPQRILCEPLEQSSVSREQLLHLHRESMSWVCYTHDAWTESLSVQCDDEKHCRVQFFVDAALECIAWNVVLLLLCVIGMLFAFAYMAVPRLLERKKVAEMRKKF